MKPDSQKTQDKRLLSLYRERQKLLIQKRQTVKLHPPIQRGWKRLYFLTKSAASRPDADTLHAILEKINVVQKHWRRDFKPTKNKRRYRMRLTIQPLRTVRETCFGLRRGLPAEWRSYFVPVLELSGGQPEWKLGFARPEFFELRIIPNLQTEAKIVIPEVESREAEIDAYLDGPRKGRLYRLLGCLHWHRGPSRQMMRGKLAAKRIRSVLAGDLDAEEKSPALRLFSSASRSVTLTTKPSCCTTGAVY